MADRSLPQLALSSCQHLLAAMLAHEADVRVGTDPEALHQMRVAVRRLNATIRMFEGHLPDWAKTSRTTFLQLLRSLGATRDLDVQIGYLREVREKLAASEQDSLAPLASLLAQERDRAYRSMLRVLDAPHTVRAIEKWRELARPEQAAADHSSPSVESFACEALRKRNRRLRKAIRSLTPTSNASEYHEVRARVKRLRYALEVFAPLYGSSATKFLRALTRLQGVMGDYQDAEVRRARLSELATTESTGLPGMTLFAMGRLAEQNTRQGHDARRRTDREFRRARGRRWKRLRSQMLTLASQDRSRAAPPPAAVGLT